MDSRPIGLFDSGVGGLSVLRELRRLAPAESLVYYADTAWFPYGSRPPAEVRKRAFAATHTLLNAGAKAIVVACNTASAAALQDLREAFSDVPFVGMVPGLKPAAQASRGGHVAILATPGTLGGGLYHQVATDFGRSVHIEEVAGHGLADAVERGAVAEPATRELLRELVTPAVDRGADALVLGCSHYAFLAPLIREEFPAVQLVDTAEAVARRTLQVLRDGDALAPEHAAAELSVIVSGSRAAFLEQVQRIDPDLVPEAVS
ncbi:MAG: glutamate racemase [Dehalococcoidia bacterium]|nr:glutamate racemase [Dehalococcoidia bacterium]